MISELYRVDDTHLEKSYLLVHRLIDETCFCKPDVDKYTAQGHLLLITPPLISYKKHYSHLNETLGMPNEIE